MAWLSLSFLGTFQAVLEGKTISRFRSSNVQGLLVYLSLQAERPFPRETLATLFWPDLPESNAKQNLRQSLYQLRKVLGDSDELEKPFLFINRHTIQFNPDSQYNMDIKHFLIALDEGDLVTAVATYPDDLLPGFTCDSLEFERWLREERERLHRLALEAMSTLTARHLRDGRINAAQEIARKQLTLEAWSETAHQQLIEALALGGNRTAALAQFEQCQEILAEELGVSPSAETFALVERIENNDLQPIDPNLIAGRYALAEEIGRGAMGVVYRGRDRQTGTAVAIKMLDEEKVSRHPELLVRFVREGEALQKLNHPNIVKLLAMAEKDGRHYLVLEYIAGGDLKQLLAHQFPLSIQHSLTIALDLADALTRAHRLDILHRDLKPANVLLDTDRLPRLSDFGIARLGHEMELTSQGEILGTLPYLSPEACLGQPLDARSDIWSFGVLLFEMLVGECPFSAPTSAETITRILHASLPDVMALRPDVPDALADLLYRMLAKSKTDRLPSVRLAGAELETILHLTNLESDPEKHDPHPAPLTSIRPVFATPTPERLQWARHNLPAQTTPFIGREAELDELGRLLADPTIRLVTIVGPGGMGKTRLSLEVGGQFIDGTKGSRIVFPNGVFLVDLASLTSVDEMITAVAIALGFAIEKGIEPLQQILNFLSNKQLLLLLDNFEHFLASPLNGAEVVTAVLQAAPDVKIIATSRQKLNLSSEVIFVLEGLAFPDWETPADALSYSAVQLFVQSARRAQVDFELTPESLAPVTRICRLTEGMPLGIVLAAAWIDMLSLAEIAEEMQADIDFLASEMGDLPPRQRSMRAVFDYSWALLTEPEQQVLPRLSVFQGGFTREAAQVVTGATLRQLLVLVNKSLIQRDVGNGRFSLHELLRQLATEKLEARGEADSVHTAHCHYYLQYLANQGPSSSGRHQREKILALASEDQNMQSAWLWAATKGNVARLLPSIEPYLLYVAFSGREFEMARVWLKALSLLPSGDPTFKDITDDVTLVRASILNRLQELGFTKDDKGRAIDIDLLYAYFHARDAKLEEGITCQHLGYRAVEQQNFEQVMFYFHRQTNLYEKENATFRLASSLAIMSSMAYRAGQIESGLMMAQRSLTLAIQNNNRFGETAALVALGLYALCEEIDYNTANERFARVTALGMDLWLEGMNAIPLTLGLAYQGFIALLQGNLSKAQQFSQKMQELVSVRNHPRDKASADLFLSLLEATMGNYKVINPKIFESISLGHTTFANLSLTLNACGLRNTPVAIASIIKGWSFPMTMRWLSLALRDLPVVAFILAERGEISRAAALLAMGWAHPACPRGWWKIMALVRELETRLQAELSPEEYAAAQARGGEMDVGETAVSLLEELKEMVSDGTIS